MNIKAVIFDIDGTFYPNWRMNLMTFPVVLRNIRLFSAFATVRKELRLMPDKHVDNFYEIQADLTAKKLGLPVDQVMKKIESDIYTEWTASLKRVKPFDNVRNVIVELQNRGFKTACLSDFPILDKLKYFGLDDLFENSAYTCEACGHLKPHPDAYSYVMEKVGVKPEEILYVGNSYQYDILGSKKAGMYAAHISKKEIDGDVKADFTFKNYYEFISKFDNLIKGV
ncbi:HAD family hydrolase [Thiospirochaeta perfilievii]|uniref:HAD family hydrolase n=1 Tax=Thiospirochaeta perfilievii TaxID=252967 RepID=A0A5C1Q9Z4_9SPIO|nr:HAD family hydrolase [Thiospirochaeta perfilievii]QEN03616.1 HAD family hydrolase [Thiospirochaeta perfilievii]